MKKLQDEVRGTASGKGMVRQREKEMSKMVYLKAVLKEVLRLHPPVPLLLPREAMEDCQIQGYNIPRKTRVIINYWAIGRDPKFWEAPEEFHPERFLESPIDFKGNYFQFIPFGAGRRICPALHFATSTVELALANLVQKRNWIWQNSGTNKVKRSKDCVLLLHPVSIRILDSIFVLPCPNLGRYILLLLASLSAYLLM